MLNLADTLLQRCYHYLKVAFLLLGIYNASTPTSIACAQAIVIPGDKPVVDLISHMKLQQPKQSAQQSQRTIMHISLASAESQTTLWRLSTEMLKPATFEFYLQNQHGRTLSLAVQYPHHPHETRASQGRVHTSKPIALAPGLPIELIALFDSPPDADSFPISLLPEAVYDRQHAITTYLHGGYIGASAVFLLFFIVFSQLFSSLPAKYYAVYYFFLGALALHSYGYTSIFADESFSELYFPAFRFIQFSIMLAYLCFAISFIRARKYYPMLFKIVCAYIVLSISLLLAEALIFDSGYLVLVQIMALGFLAISVATVVVALRDRLAGATLFALGFIVLLINGVANYIASFPSLFKYNNTVDAATLGLQLVDAFIFAAAIVSQTRGLKRDRDDALQARLVATEEKLLISEQLRQSEHERDTATLLAERHRSRLAATSHDLRQPLSSLKLALQDTQSLPADAHGKLASGLEYLNSVLDEALDDSMPASHHSESDRRNAAGHSADYEEVPLQIILDNISRMFSSEAVNKGLELRVGNTTLIASSSAVMLIRVLSNVVANAIKYTQANGTILIVARRRQNTIALQVWDSGPGLDENTLHRVMQRYQRGDNVEDTDGLGLGLSIVHKLLQQHGLSLDVNSTVGVGSVFTIKGIERVYKSE